MSLVDGVPSERIPVTDRGLQYGDGLFETLRVQDGRALRWERHMARLANGCERLGIPVPAPELLRREAHAVCDGATRGVLKLIITRGGAGRGYRPADAVEAHRVLTLHPAPEYPESFHREGVTVRVCATRLAIQPELAGVKHLNRLEQVLARREWDDPAVPEGLMLDSADNLVEGTMTNVFLVRDGELLTPELSRCGVAGIMREVVLETAARLGITQRMARVPVRALEQADELFVCNSVIGIWPIRRIGGRGYPLGPVTRRLAAGVAEDS